MPCPRWGFSAFALGGLATASRGFRNRWTAPVAGRRRERARARPRAQGPARGRGRAPGTRWRRSAAGRGRRAPAEPTRPVRTSPGVPARPGQPDRRRRPDDLPRGRPRRPESRLRRPSRCRLSPSGPGSGPPAAHQRRRCPWSTSVRVCGPSLSVPAAAPLNPLSTETRTPAFRAGAEVRERHVPASAVTLDAPGNRLRQEHR